MKSLTLLAIYVASFITIYLMLSCIPAIATNNYLNVIQDSTWLILYSLLFGWWMALFPTREYYNKHKVEFNRIFN